LGNVQADGGGIYNAGGTLTLTSCILTNNGSGLTTGGGILNTGTLTLTNCTLTDNRADSGGGISNSGTLTLTNSTLAHNEANHPGGGILNTGTLTLTNCTLTDNGADSGGGIVNRGTGSLSKCTLTDNRAFAGGGILNTGTLTLTNSTLAHNFAGEGGGISNRGTLTLTNCTVAHNFAEDGGGILVRGMHGFATLQNTVLALNDRSDCFGTVISLGANLIGDSTECTVTLQASDLTGDPGLGDFTNAGTPGHGHFPLLPTSQAIDTGNEAACPLTDQLGQPRSGRCDIGAVEFVSGISVVNDLVTFVPLTDTYETRSDPTGCPAGFVGTFRFQAQLTPQPSSPPLTNLGVVVTTLSSGNLLQNADGGPGGVGATLTVLQTNALADGILSPGEAVEVPFEICLTAIAPFTLLVDVRGAGAVGAVEPVEASENLAVLP
jgi:hypothetical protein